ncbi:MAG: GNAT family N-acetyltransferase [Thermomicrobiales bacterium]
MTVLETPRLHLRQVTHDDTDNLLGIFSDPQAMRYYPSTKDRQQTAAWIEWNLRSYQEHGIGLWIVEAKTTGQFLGQCGLTMQEVEGSWEPEVGYLFLREHWGHGYATEAAAAALTHGFTYHGYPRIICLPSAANLPSRRVAERLGMHLERQLTRRGLEMCVYALTNPNHEPSRPSLSPHLPIHQFPNKVS